MDLKLQVVHEDARLIAVDKPSGMPTIPARGLDIEPACAAAERLTGGKVWIVHRLDRDASGLLLFAKDAEAHRALSGRFEAREAEKVYLCAVIGRWIGDGLIDAPLKQFGSGRQGVSPEGKASVTAWRAVKLFSDCTLVEARPKTGRRHQLRVHFFHAGHPILGDTRYGYPRPVGGAARLMLHAWKLKLEGPSGLLDLTCEPGADFAAVLGTRA